MWAPLNSVKKGLGASWRSLCFLASPREILRQTDAVVPDARVVYMNRGKPSACVHKRYRSLSAR